MTERTSEFRSKLITGATRKVLEREYSARHLVTDDPKLSGRQIEYLVLKNGNEVYVWKRANGSGDYYQLHLGMIVKEEMSVN